MRAGTSRSVAVLVTIVLLVGACGVPAASLRSAVPTEAPTSALPTSRPSPSGGPSTSASPSSAALPTATPAPPDPFLGQVVVTVSDRLRVRSQPWVGDDSTRYEPLLPIGTELKVLAGPVEGSGFVWYQVKPASVVELDEPGYGWVAMAGKDGEPWIALADAPIAGIELAKASVPRAPADPAAASTAATSINAFGLDLLRAMLADGTLDPGANAVFSPTSIALALGMARAGAKSDTAAEMDKVLHTAGWEELGDGLNALEQALTSRNTTWEEEGYRSETDEWGTVTHELTVRIANSAFAQQDWALEQAYLDRIASTFGAGVRLVDFVANVEAARKLVNAWVNDQTERRIPELIQAGMLDQYARLVLVNAIYLKAAWATPFDPDITEPAGFTRLDGSRVEVPTMTTWLVEERAPYARGNGWQATELLYQGPEWSRPLAMTLIQPEDLPAFERALTATQLMRVAGALDSQRELLLQEREEEVPGAGFSCPSIAYDVRLFLPRFSTETQASLPDILRALGMPLAFAFPTADFSGIHAPETEHDRLFISEVVHQANIDVDEKGTEAAAATAVNVDTGGGCGAQVSGRKTITVRLDHPFLFVLRDVETGAVLFMGRVVDPSIGH